MKEGSNLNAMGQTILTEPPIRQDTSRLPTERPNMPEEDIVSVKGPNTPAVVRDSVIGILRIKQVGATTQTLAQPSEVILPPRIGDYIAIPHVNLSASGYEPDSLGSSGIRSPPARAQETSTVSQLDGPGSLPTVNPAQKRMGRPPNQMEQDPSQGGIYVWKTGVSKRREYPEEGANGDEYRRPN